jgi:hypothetical protein
MRVLAIVPAFNEEENLSALLAELRQVNVDSVILDAPSRMTHRPMQPSGWRRIPECAVGSFTKNLGIGDA